MATMAADDLKAQIEHALSELLGHPVGIAGLPGTSATCGFCMELTLEAERIKAESKEKSEFQDVIVFGYGPQHRAHFGFSRMTAWDKIQLGTMLIERANDLLQDGLQALRREMESIDAAKPSAEQASE